MWLEGSTAWLHPLAAVPRAFLQAAPACKRATCCTSCNPPTLDSMDDRCALPNQSVCHAGGLRVLLLAHASTFTLRLQQRILRLCALLAQALATRSGVHASTSFPLCCPRMRPTNCVAPAAKYVTGPRASCNYLVQHHDRALHAGSNPQLSYGFHAPFLRLQCHMAMPCGLHVITCLVMYGTPCHGSYATTWLPCHSALTPHDISTMCFGSHATAPLASMRIAVPPAHRLPRHMAPMP